MDKGGAKAERGYPGPTWGGNMNSIKAVKKPAQISQKVCRAFPFQKKNYLSTKN